MEDKTIIAISDYDPSIRVDSVKLNPRRHEFTTRYSDELPKPTFVESVEAINNLISQLGDTKCKVSDGFHTFESLYNQRCILFATIVNMFKSLSWKSHRHSDGELCFGGGWFIVGIQTPAGDFTYHYEDKYWDLFDCEEWEKGKVWDGHTEDDINRLLSLVRNNKTSE